MNAFSPIKSPPARLQGVMVYVLDEDSEAAFKRVAVHLGLPGFEIRRGDIATACAALRSKRSPAVLFVDVTGVDRVLDAVQALSDVCEPQLKVVVIGDRNDIGLYRGLLRLGVSDYLFKPVTAELVEQLVERLTGSEKRGDDLRLGKVLAVTGARGGTGASSIAANVAHYLAEKAGRRVALIDMDTSSGAQALLLGASPNSGLAEALASPGRVDDLFLERATISISGRLDLMASEMQPGRDQSVSEEATQIILSRLQMAYHYVVIDVPQVAMARCRPLLAAANLQLLVTEATLLAARDTARRQDPVNLMGQRQILVHNKAGRPGDLSAADFSGALKRPPDVTIPFLPEAFGQAVNMGLPAWNAEPRASAAIALLARELSGQSVEISEPPAWKRLLGLVP